MGYIRFRVECQTHAFHRLSLPDGGWLPWNIRCTEPGQLIWTPWIHEKYEKILKQEISRGNYILRKEKIIF